MRDRSLIPLCIPLVAMACAHAPDRGLESRAEHELGGATSPPRVNLPESPPPAPAKPPPREKDDALKLAQQRLDAAEYVEARQLFRQFLERWPDDERVAAAYFGIGETYFRLHECREALFEYGRVIQEFPESDAAPEAYLRTAECFERLSMPDEARIALEEVAREYAASEAAARAKAKLATLEARPPSSAGSARRGPS